MSDDNTLSQLRACSLESLTQQALPWAQLLIDKIGSAVDASDVVSHGGSALHGMDPSGGVTFVPPAPQKLPSLHIDSLDAGLVLPAVAQTPWNFTAFFETPARADDGVQFCLFNNLYVSAATVGASHLTRRCLTPTVAANR